MNQVAYSKKAREDLLSIWSYIAEDSPNAANRLLDTIKENGVSLGDNPDLGQTRPDLSPTIRYFPVKNYIILYQKISHGIDVIRILHGARDLRGALHSG